MKFDAGGFVVDADVAGVRRDGRGGAGKEAWGEWVGGGGRLERELAVGLPQTVAPGATRIRTI